MAQVAAVAVAWTEIEASLINLVNCSLGTAHLQSEHVVSMSGNWVARTAMEQAETIRTRVKLVDALIEPLLLEHALLQRWVALRDQLKKCSRKRNEIIHANWNYAEELPGELIRVRPGNHERWTIADFSEVQGRFHELNMGICALTHDIGLVLATGGRPV